MALTQFVLVDLTLDRSRKCLLLEEYLRHVRRSLHEYALLLTADYSHCAPVKNTNVPASPVLCIILLHSTVEIILKPQPFLVNDALSSLHKIDFERLSECSASSDVHVRGLNAAVKYLQRCESSVSAHVSLVSMRPQDDFLSLEPHIMALLDRGDVVEIVNVDLPLAGKMDESENNAVTNVSNEAFISPTLQLLSRIRYRRIPLEYGSMSMVTHDWLRDLKMPHQDASIVFSSHYRLPVRLFPMHALVNIPVRKVCICHEKITLESGSGIASQTCRQTHEDLSSVELRDCLIVGENRAILPSTSNPALKLESDGPFECVISGKQPLQAVDDMILGNQTWMIGYRHALHRDDSRARLDAVCYLLHEKDFGYVLQSSFDTRGLFTKPYLLFPTACGQQLILKEMLCFQQCLPYPMQCSHEKEDQCQEQLRCAERDFEKTSVSQSPSKSRSNFLDACGMVIEAAKHALFLGVDDVTLIEEGNGPPNTSHRSSNRITVDDAASAMPSPTTSSNTPSTIKIGKKVQDLKLIKKVSEETGSVISPLSDQKMPKGASARKGRRRPSRRTAVQLRSILES